MTPYLKVSKTTEKKEIASKRCPSRELTTTAKSVFGLRKKAAGAFLRESVPLFTTTPWVGGAVDMGAHSQCASTLGDVGK